MEAPLDMVPWGGGSLPLSSFQKNNIRLLYLIRDTQKIGNISQNVMLKITCFSPFLVVKINTVGQNIPPPPLTCII